MTEGYGDYDVYVNGEKKNRWGWISKKEDRWNPPKEKTSWERARDIFAELDSDPELMADFQLQLRRRKLKQLKKK